MWTSRHLGGDGGWPPLPPLLKAEASCRRSKPDHSTFLACLERETSLLHLPKRPPCKWEVALSFPSIIQVKMWILGLHPSTCEVRSEGGGFKGDLVHNQGCETVLLWTGCPDF